MEKQVKLTDLKEGDKVLWGEREEPMIVKKTSFDSGVKVAQLESNRGKSYNLIVNELAEGTDQNPKITPRQRARMPVARNLRVVSQ